MNLHEATLPIQTTDGLHMDPQEALALGSLFQGDYAGASPFPHIVLDGILPEEVLRIAERGFPDAPLKSDRVFEMDYAGHHKRQILPEECGAEVRTLFHFFNSAPVLKFLEGLTGIEGLLPDPYFVGGGFHEITRGGLLGVHADFRINEQLHVERRLNMLIYLNEPWDEAWGGHLELWDRKMTRCESKVAPLRNRCVVFSTDADSYHGHPDPLQTPDGIKRRSIALYYYTASRSIYQEVPAHSTIYQARPDDPAEIRRQARQLRIDQYLKDWLPPAVHRLVGKVRHRLGA